MLSLFGPALCRPPLYCCLVAGVNLLDLPVEILQSISAHFKAEEWARGASQACRQFNNMHLPHIFVRPPYPREPPLEEVEDVSLPLCSPVDFASGNYARGS